jgi:hypothetical protein
VFCGIRGGFGVDSHAGGWICGLSADLVGFSVALCVSGLPRKQGKCDGDVKNFGDLVHFPLAGFGWWA